MPSSPWTCRACLAGSSSGRAAPRATGTSGLPAASSTVRVLAHDVVDAGVAGHTGHRHEVEARVPRGEQQGARVVDAGVDVQHDGQGPGGHAPDLSGGPS